MSDSIQLSQLIPIVLKRWWWLCIAVVVSMAIGYGISVRQTAVYQSTTTLLVGQSMQATGFARADIFIGQQLALTYASMARRQSVLQVALDELGLNDSWTALQKRVRTQLITGTPLLEITVEADSAQDAQAIANAIAKALAELGTGDLQSEEQAQAQHFVKWRLDTLLSKITAAQERVDTVDATIASTSSDEQVDALRDEINTLENRIMAWENNYARFLAFAEEEVTPNFITVVEPADINFNSIRPRTRLNLLMAVVIGLCLTLGFIFLREHLDNRLRSPIDLKQGLGLTTLGVISTLRGKRYQDQLITVDAPFSPMSEAYRMIGTNIQMMCIGASTQSIMVTSSNNREGKSITSANLGVVMARAGFKTIVIDCDLRRPVIHRIFQVANAGGVRDLLNTQNFEVVKYLKRTTVGNLHVITSGVTSPNISDILSLHFIDKLLLELNDLADVIIFDCPSATSAADATIVSSRVDGVLFVVQAGQTRLDIAEQAIFNLKQSDATLLGGILNQVSSQYRIYPKHQVYPMPKGHQRAKQSKSVKPLHLWQWRPFRSDRSEALGSPKNPEQYINNHLNQNGK